MFYKVWTGSARNTEVDFVCKNSTGEIEYYQVAWQLTNESTVQREFGALEKNNFILRTSPESLPE